MCSYPCFGLSKTDFTPPSQLLKLINFFFKTDTASLPMQKSAAKTASMPIMKSAAKTKSSFHIYIYTYIFSWVFTFYGSISSIIWFHVYIGRSRLCFKMDRGNSKSNQ